MNIPGRYLYPAIAPPFGSNLGAFPTRVLLINPYGTGVDNAGNSYVKEIAWGNAFDMSTIPWGQVFTANFTDDSGAPTSTSGPAPGSGLFTCNNPWASNGTMQIVDSLVSGPCNVLAIKMIAFNDWTGSGGPCDGGTPCGDSPECGAALLYVTALEGCCGVVPVSCGGDASGPCNQQIIHFPMDVETLQPCGGICKAGIFRGLSIPLRNAGDGSTQPGLLEDWAGQMAAAVCTNASDGLETCTPSFGGSWDNTVQCTATGETYSDPP